MNSKKKMLIYGAGGYTGKIIAARAKELNLDFEIAGREETKISALASELNVPYHVFNVDDESSWQEVLVNIHVVINAAGPFRFTAQQGIQIISGAGLFVSYDALAVHLSKLVEEPQKLSIGFRHYGGFSRGSVLSSKNIADLGLLIRKDGIIVENIQPESKVFSFGSEDVECLPTPLGGIILTYKSTGIPNIEEYFSLKLPSEDMPNLTPENLPEGPSAEERAAGRNGISGEIKGKDGKIAKAYIDTPSGYTLTPLSVVAIANRILNEDFKIGFQSPGSAYGESILKDIPDTYLFDL